MQAGSFLRQRSSWLFCAVLTSLGVSASAIADPQLTILAGDDSWRTSPAHPAVYTGFTQDPIPADFFHPGSDPFIGTVQLQGAPLAIDPPSAAGPYDAIVRRLADADLPSVPSADVIPIEIVALHLQSVAPITVTSGGGPTFWDVQVVLSGEMNQNPGQMEIELDCDAGGTFRMDLPIIPKFIFTESGNPSNVKIYDISAGSQPFIIYTDDTRWSNSQIPPWQRFPVFPGSDVDHDLNPGTPAISLNPPSNDFFPGLGTLPCDPDAPGACMGLDEVKIEIVQMQLTSIAPLLNSPPTLGATCLPEGGCIITDPSCAGAVGGFYQGDGSVCDPLSCIGDSYAGIEFQQVDYLFDSATVLNSGHGRMFISDPPLFGSQFPNDTGYINVYSDNGWIVQNVWMDATADGPFAHYFELLPYDGRDHVFFTANVTFTPAPIFDMDDGLRGPYPIGVWSFNAEGSWSDLGDAIKDIGEMFKPGYMPFDSMGLFERTSQPNKSNIQAARNQCVPMSIANSLQYLEDRYGLPVPHNHVAGLEGDNSLVGQLGSHMQRSSTSRSSGEGVYTQPRAVPSKRGMVAGKMSYLKANGLSKKLVHRHQGTIPPSGLTPAGDFTSSGITSKDESVGGRVTFDWICDQIKKGEDVELVFGYYNAAGGARNGGHAVRVFECGKTWGVPWIGYVHDALQTDKDPGDTLGLECVRTYFTDSDNDGAPNLQNNVREADFAFSESADNDMDGVTQGIDNAPGHWNPNQEDEDGNGIGDVAESPILNEDDIDLVPELMEDDSVKTPFYFNELPTDPSHKDIWFLGTGINPGPDTAKVVIDFIIKDGATLTTFESDTSEIFPGDTSTIFGGVTIDHCPDSVCVQFTALGNTVQQIDGILSHICYPLPGGGGCCDLPGDANNDGNVNIADVTFLIARIFAGGPPPPCCEEGDANGDGAVNIGDVTFLISRIFAGSAAPVCGPAGMVCNAQ